MLKTKRFIDVVKFYIKENGQNILKNHDRQELIKFISWMSEKV